MRTLFEFDITQNSVIGAMALHSAILQCYDSNGRANGMPIPQSFLVLPIVFHQETRKHISGLAFNGSFYRALALHRAVAAGLQKRMQSMQHLTLTSLNVALNAALIFRDTVSGVVTFRPKRLSGIPVQQDDETKEILAAAKRVGHWIGTVKLETLCSLLSVSF